MAIYIPTYTPSLDEILDGRELTTAEQRLLDCCKTGEHAFFGMAVPDTPNDENSIDAALIRYLLLGGCDENPVSPIGVRVIGAYISGVLNFEGCETALTLVCAFCQFSDEPNFMDAEIGHLNLQGSHVPGLKGHRMRVKRDVFMRGDFKAGGTVNLSAADIGGQLACSGCTFDGAGNTALNCDAIQVGADVFLSDGFKAVGLVNFVGATIGGQFACSGGTFDGGRIDGKQQTALNCDAMQVGADVFLNGGFKATGQVDFVAATIGGQLACSGGTFDGAGITALNCGAMQVAESVLLRERFKAIGAVNFIRANIAGNLQCENLTLKGDFIAEKMCVGAAFTWRGIAGKQDAISLRDAQVGVLADDLESWGNAEHLLLKGFTYGALDNQFRDFPFQKRLEWVGRSYCADHQQPEGNEEIVVIDADKERFEPQPYVQLAKVYEADGQRGAAARVREEMERRLRRSEYVKARLGIAGRDYLEERRILARPKAGLDWVFGQVFGYGHAPMRGVGYAVLLVCMISFFYAFVWDRGQFAPNSDIILTSADWRVFADDETVVNPAAAWSADKAGTDYESFNAIGYGLDLFLPLDALGQEAAWAPSKDRGALGAWGFYLRWVVQFLGWVFTGVLAAALTGIIGRKE